MRRIRTGPAAIKAPAKINLFLRVLGRRHDGYHNIETVFHVISLCDEITLSPAKAVKFTSSGIPVPKGKGNLCVRAAELLREYCGIKAGARIRLLKRIPSGAGLGGGSSDAAACLLGLNRLWKTGLNRSALLKLAARLGSDVPFFILGRAALGRGRGELLTPLKSRLRGWVVVLKPRFGISTADAYRALDREERPPVARNAIKITVEAVRKGNLRNLSAYNDFESVAARMHPQIDDLILALRGAGAVHSFMTGSGSALVGVFRTEAMAKSAATRAGKDNKVKALVAKL